jgi:hypothetical protein
MAARWSGEFIHQSTIWRAPTLMPMFSAYQSEPAGISLPPASLRWIVARLNVPLVIRSFWFSAHACETLPMAWFYISGASPLLALYWLVYARTSAMNESWLVRTAAEAGTAPAIMEASSRKTATRDVAAVRTDECLFSIQACALVET